MSIFVHVFRAEYFVTIYGNKIINLFTILLPYFARLSMFFEPSQNILHILQCLIINGNEILIIFRLKKHGQNIDILKNVQNQKILFQIYFKN